MIHRRTIVTLEALLDSATSSSWVSSALFMMRLNRADASLPISTLITRSVTIWSAISTRWRRRVFG